MDKREELNAKSGIDLLMIHKCIIRGLFRWEKFGPKDGLQWVLQQNLYS
jgi:hypothetical protein